MGFFLYNLHSSYLKRLLLGTITYKPFKEISNSSYFSLHFQNSDFYFFVLGEPNLVLLTRFNLTFVLYPTISPAIKSLC